MRKKLLFVGIAAIFLFAIAAVGKRPDKEAKVPHLDRAPQEGIYRSQTLTKSYIPPHINYQGYLTDVWGSPINDTLNMVFRIYDAPTGGMELWGEAQPLVPVQNGLFNVLLGRVNPIPPDVFIDPNRWLQTEIDGQTLSPRKQIVSVGYSFGSVFSDEAFFALTADSASFATEAGVAGFAHGVRPPVILIDNLPLAVLEVTNTGPGDGIFVGNVGADAVRVDSAGDDGLHVRHADNYGLYVGDAYCGVWVDSASWLPGVGVRKATYDGVYVGNAGFDGLFVGNAGLDGVNVGSAGRDGILVLNAGFDGVYVDSAGWDGFSVRHADYYGVYVNHADSCGVYVHEACCGVWVDSAYCGSGVYVRKASDDGVYVDTAGSEGFHVFSTVDDGLDVDFAGDNGVDIFNATTNGIGIGFTGNDGCLINQAGDDGFQVLDAADDGFQVDSCGGDGLYVRYADGSGVRVDSSSGSGVWVSKAGWHGAWLETGNPAAWGAVVASDGLLATNNGLYVFGTFTATGTKASAVKTSHGMEQLYAIESPDVEFMASGIASLVNGEARVTFERLFGEAISDHVPLKIVVTPKGTWSGLYVAAQSYEGFTVKCGAGDPNATFDWIAIGRRKAYETRPEAELLLPKIASDEKMVAQREAEELDRQRMKEALKREGEELEARKTHKEKIRERRTLREKEMQEERIKEHELIRPRKRMERERERIEIERDKINGRSKR